MSDETKAQELISIFVCEKDADIENFLKSRAIQFEKLGKSRTFFIYDEDQDEFQILAYFTLAIQVLKIPEGMLSGNKVKKLDGLSANMRGSRITEFPSILIGQLGKNEMYPGVISGSEVLEYCLVQTIRNILRNEIYRGNYLYQKAYIKDTIEKKVVMNRGELPQYLIENHHKAIVDNETWEKVQKVLQARREKYENKKSIAYPEDKMKNTSLEDIYTCGECGSKIGHRRSIQSSNEIHSWICTKAAKSFLVDTCVKRNEGIGHGEEIYFREDIFERVVLSAQLYSDGRIVYELSLGIQWSIDFKYSAFQKLLIKWKDKQRAEEKEAYLEGPDVKELLEFCKEPKSYSELHVFMCERKEVSYSYFRKLVIRPLMKKGKLKFTIPEDVMNRHQRYTSN